MRIVCPSCDTAYDAPDSVVATGRLMRCARCRTEWTPGRPVEAPLPSAPVPAAEDTVWVAAATPVPSEQIESEDRFARATEPRMTEAEPVILAPFPPMPAAPEPAKKTVVAAWVASVIVLILAFWLAISFRQSIMRVWPASARAYGVLGYK